MRAREPLPIGACLLSLVLGLSGALPAAADPGQDCKLDEPGRPAGAVVVPPPPAPPRVAQCALAAKLVLARVRAGTMLLVDVRPAAEFERYRIAGSLNIAPAFVKTKTFLQGQPFALVSDAHASGELEALCASLKQAGFAHAGVLEGGLLAWRKAQGPLEGDRLAQGTLTRIAPADFALERGDPRWLVIDLSGAPPKEVQRWLPGAVRAPAGRAEAKLAGDVKTIAAKRTRKGQPLRLLIVDADGSQRERLEPALAASLSQEVLFLDGGLAGWRKYWAEQNAIWAASDRGARKAKCGA